MERATPAPTAALGDCAPCFDAVCKDASGLLISHAWKLDATQQPALCHWAQEIGWRTLAYQERGMLYEAACGRTFTIPEAARKW